MYKWLLLAFCAAAFSAAAEDVTLHWDLPSDLTDVAGYEIHHGDKSGVYTAIEDVPGATTTQATITGVAKPEFFAARSRNADATKFSAFSNEAVLAAQQVPDNILAFMVVRGSGGGGGGSDPAFVGVSDWITEETTDVDSMTVTLPGVSVSDLVIALTQRNGESNATGCSINGQAMTKVKTAASESADFNLDVWTVLSSSAGDLDITVSYSDSAQWGSMVAAAWSNVSSATPTHSSCNAIGCSGRELTSTSRTAQEITTSARSLIVAVGTDWNNYNVQTAVNGYTKRFDTDIAGGNQIQWIYSKVSDAGSFGGAANFGTADPDLYMSALLSFE